jgi:hypothetical protein
VTSYQPQPLSEDVEPWERQPGESERHYSYFAHYRDTGRTRTLANAAEALAAMGARLSYRHARNLAARWSWLDRAAAWDREQDRVYAAEMAGKRRELAERESRLAWAMVAKVAGRLNRLTDAEVDQVTLPELARCAHLAFGWLHTVIPDQPAAATPAARTRPAAVEEDTLPDPSLMSTAEQVEELLGLRAAIDRQLDALGIAD